MDFASMDPASAKLAVEYCLSDIQDLLDSLYDVTLPEDQRIGLETMKTEMQHQLVILEGQVLALRILKQEHDNRVAFTKLVQEETQAATDHNLALELSAMGDEQPSLESVQVPVDLSVDDTISTERTLVAEDEEETNFADDQWEAVKRLYSGSHFDQISLPAFLTDQDHEDRMDEEDITNAAERGFESSCVCIACYQTKNVNDTLTLTCTHTYCRTCLMRLFKGAIADNTLFPPRCCKSPIPVDTCRALLPKELIKEFDLKLEELSTPNPTYCSSCNAFLRPQDMSGGTGTCPFCKKKTCAACKRPKHNGLCPQDPHVGLLMERARRSHWQQCSRCNQLVELAHGCFHMSCPCGHDFCYLCGMRWKSCLCPKFDEHFQAGRSITVDNCQHVYNKSDKGPTCGGCFARPSSVMQCSRCLISWRCTKCTSKVA